MSLLTPAHTSGLGVYAYGMIAPLRPAPSAYTAVALKMGSTCAPLPPTPCLHGRRACFQLECASAPVPPPPTRQVRVCLLLGCTVAEPHPLPTYGRYVLAGTLGLRASASHTTACTAGVCACRWRALSCPCHPCLHGRVLAGTLRLHASASPLLTRQEYDCACSGRAPSRPCHPSFTWQVCTPLR